MDAPFTSPGFFSNLLGHNVPFHYKNGKVWLYQLERAFKICIGQFVEKP